MAFNPNEHLRKLKGQDYLDVKWRLMWLREDYPDARITTELVRLDLEERLAVFRAEVSIPDKGSATGFGSETEKDFPLGWVEKAETKAIGRALAALGFGTQFAVELDEGDRVVDSPVSRPQQAPRPVAAPPASAAMPAAVSTGQAKPVERDRGGLKVVASDQAPAGDRTATLRQEVSASLAADKDAASKLPKSTDDMNAAELEKTLTWLRNRAQRQA